MNQLEALWEYQEAEFAFAKLKKEVKSTPARQKLAKLRSFLTEQQNAIKSIQQGMDERNVQLEACSVQFANLVREYELEKSDLDIMENDEQCTAAELSEARKSIERLQDKINALGKGLSESVNWIEKTSTEINTTWTRASKAKREYDALRAVCDAELDDFRPQLAAAEATIIEKRANVPDDLFKRYSAIKKNHALPVAKVEHGQCGGCNMMLPSVVVKKVAAGTGIVECENCGRLLIS